MCLSRILTFLSVYKLSRLSNSWLKIVQSFSIVIDYSIFASNPLKLSFKLFFLTDILC